MNFFCNPFYFGVELPEDGVNDAETCSSILLQSALQPLWVMACSTIVEYSQQEGFYRVPLLAARQTPNLEDQ